jgi:glycosyltransferase involved in cell wall biosynthesis
MRIAYVVGRFPSPSETFIAREIAALEARGVQVEVFPLWPSGTGAPSAHPVQRVGRWGLREQFLHPWKHTRWQFRFQYAFWREGRGALQATWHEGRMLAMGHRMRKLGVDWVHAHFGNVVSTAGWRAADVAGVPFSFSVHARDVFVEAQFLREKARAARRILACNSAAGTRAREQADVQDAAKVALVPHGLPLDAYPFREHPASGAPLILAVGRLVEKKGFVHLLRALARLRPRRGGVRAWLVGDGPERERLVRERGALGLGDVVEWKGWLSEAEVRAAYEHAAVLVAPSIVARDGDMDGLPNVVVEAAAMGVPLVTTDVGGLGDLVRDGETGLIARPADADDLAEKIHTVLDEPAVALARARAARAEVEARFDLTACAARLVEALGLDTGNTE